MSTRVNLVVERTLELECTGNVYGGCGPVTDGRGGAVIAPAEGPTCENLKVCLVVKTGPRFDDYREINITDFLTSEMREQLERELVDEADG